MFRGSNSGLLRLEVLNVDVALLARHPAFLDQRSIPAPSHLREPSVGLRLVQRRLELSQHRLVLRDLIVEFRHSELRQQFPCLNAIADIDVALDDIAGRAGIDIRRREGGRGTRQGDRHGAGAFLDRRDAHTGYEITRLLGGRDDVLTLRSGGAVAGDALAGSRSRGRPRGRADDADRENQNHSSGRSSNTP